MRQLLNNVTSALMVTCAVIVTVVVVRREMLAGTQGRFERVENWQRFMRTEDRANARQGDVVVVTFADYQCPGCRLFDEQLRRVNADFRGRLKRVYRHLPLPMHAHAWDAARAGECSRDQGRFEVMDSVLFANQSRIGTLSWQQLAHQAGVPDTAVLRKCMEGRFTDARIAEDTLLASREGIRGTPTVLLNGIRFAGVPPEAELRRLIAAARDGGT